MSIPTSRGIGDGPIVTVIGPGAIGCALAAGLVEGGNTPRFAGRSTFDQLAVDHPSGRVVADVEVFVNPTDVPASDVVFLATKANQTADAAPMLRAACHEATVIVVAQNGVEQRQLVQPFVPAGSPLLPAVIRIPAHRSASGQVRVGGPATVTLPDEPHAAEIAALFDGSFVRAVTSDDFISVAWGKLMINAAFGAMQVLTRRNNHVFHDDEGYELGRRIMAEIIPVARAEGATIADDLPDKILQGAPTNADGHLSSIAADRLAGNPTEWRERNDVVRRVAQRHGLEAPLNELMTTLIRLGEPDTPQ